MSLEYYDHDDDQGSSDSDGDKGSELDRSLRIKDIDENGSGETESEYSSDQEESMSSSSSSSSLSSSSNPSWSSSSGSEDNTYLQRKSHANDDRTPRRVIRIKQRLIESLECILLIISRSMGDGTVEVELGRRIGDNHNGVKPKQQGNSNKKKAKSTKMISCLETPWTRLVELIRLMNVEGRVDRDPEEIRSCLGIMYHLIETKLTTLSQNKKYLHALSGIESRTARSFKSTTTNTQSHGVHTMTPELSKIVEETPLFLLLRLIRYSLHCDHAKPRVLDLSKLPFENVNSFLEELDFDILLRLVGMDVSEVEHVDLSENRMINQGRYSSSNTNFPNFHSSPSAFPFPNIQTLNLSNIPRLKSIPLSTVRLSRLRWVICKNTPLNKPSKRSNTDDYGNYSYEFDHSIDINSRYQLSTISRQSLVHACILSLHGPKLYHQFHDIEELAEYDNTIRAMLPDGYWKMYKDSWACDRCFEFQVGPSSTNTTYQSSSNTISGWIISNPLLSRNIHDVEEKEQAIVRGKQPKSNIINVSGRCCLRCKKEIANRHRRYGIDIPLQLRKDLGIVR